MPPPTATYRLQLGPGMGLTGARALVPYLHALGVTGLYSSPILKAHPGVEHGYAVCDPTRLDERIGSLAELEAIAHELHARGMALLLDIVPNHMSASVDNPWWRDVLVHGPASPFAMCFDIDWGAGPPGAGGDRARVALPILGKPLDESINAGDLGVAIEGAELVLRAPGHTLPIDPGTYALALPVAADEPPRMCQGLRARSLGVPRRVDAARDGPTDRPRACAAVRVELERVLADDAGRGWVERSVARLGADASGLRRLIDAQAYAPMHWRAGLRRLNYRRFFDIAELAGVRIEDPRVFDIVHGLIADLVRRGVVDALRVDHVDGLADPAGYLARLRGLWPAGARTCVVVEKILTAGERLPDDWPIEGTTGYEFGGAIDAALLDPAGVQAIVEHEIGSGGAWAPFEPFAFAKKRLVMRRLLRAEVRAMRGRVLRLLRGSPHLRRLGGRTVARAFEALCAGMPVYRTYSGGGAVLKAGRAALAEAAERATRLGGADAAAVDLVRRLLAGDMEEAAIDRAARDGLVVRWRQTTGAIMAKGVEDTALYAWTPFAALCEVGGEPTPPTDGPGALHALLGDRARRWPHALNATSTHDTKRSEDVRARLLVLSECAAEWTASLERWRREMRAYVDESGGERSPTRAEESLLFQTLLGVWPLEDSGFEDLGRRVARYMLKAVREAKERTSWRRPDEQHEEIVRAYLAAALLRARSGALPGFPELERKTTFHGAVNALSALTLKLAAPGAPDFYQGSELWTFALVDPDNRAPVDFERRRRLLAEVDGLAGGGAAPAARALLAGWRDGRIKMWLTAAGLRARHDAPGLFGAGGYEPLRAAGERADHVVAFARHAAGAWAIAAAPRLTCALTDVGAFPTGDGVWAGTTIPLPAGAPVHWRNVFTDERHEAGPGASGRALPVGAIFGTLAGAILVSE